MFTGRQKKTVLRQTWTHSEKVAVLKHLGKYILAKKLPGKNVIEKCQKAESCLKHRKWTNIKDFCRNRFTIKDPLKL